MDAEKNHARGVYAKRENGRVNREIARHTQNSTARWNLNSVNGGVEFASVCSISLHLSPTFSSPPFGLTSPLLSLRIIPRHPSTPLPFPTRASYSLSFVIRKQTEAAVLPSWRSRR